MNKIKEFRKKNNLTQWQFARLVGVQRTTVTLWELGINKPRIDTLLKLSNILQCPIDELLSAKASAD